MRSGKREDIVRLYVPVENESFLGVARRGFALDDACRCVSHARHTRMRAIPCRSIGRECYCGGQTRGGKKPQAYRMDG